MRTEFTNKIKALAARRANGKCEQCGRRLQYGEAEYDHEIPDAIGGTATLENCKVLCRSCHAGKTAKVDAPRIAKTRRNFKRANNIKRKSSFACARDGKWKRKIDGTVVLRKPQRSY